MANSHVILLSSANFATASFTLTALTFDFIFGRFHIDTTSRATAAHPIIDTTRQSQIARDSKMAPKDTELYDLLGVQPEATDIEYVQSLLSSASKVAWVDCLLTMQIEEGLSKDGHQGMRHSSDVWSSRL